MTAARSWIPRGASAWTLTAAAVVLAATAATVAVCMWFPVRWDGLGLSGAVALMFPLHLLAATAAAAFLAFLAVRRRARLAALVSVIATVLTAIMALTPVVAVWRTARELGVSLSLGDYIACAFHTNSGVPQPDKSAVYATAPDGTKLELDVWRTGRPDTGSLRPAVVFVHGGAFVRGTRSMHPDWNRWLNGLGYEVFDVEYRMPPPVRGKDEVGDVKAALGWVAAHAAEYHVDPSRISAMGNSAGANLAMLAAYSMDDPQLSASVEFPPLAIRSVVDLYGPTDLALLYRNCKSREYVRTSLGQYLGGAPEEFPERYRILSPLGHVDSKSPPTIALLGGRDRLVGPEQAELLDQALARAGVPHELVLLPANDHGFDFNWGGFGTQIARARIAAFLARHG